MTDRSMDAVEVYISKGNMVVIKQDSAMMRETSHVTLHPDQVETVIRWLQEAKVEALGLRQLEEEVEAEDAAQAK